MMHEIVQQSLKPFENYPDNSRVWVYQADRILSVSEVDVIESKLKDFILTWAAHGKGLDASFAILFNTFIILIVNETLEKASGCSIDSSVKVIKDLGENLKVNFFDRFAIAFIQNDEFNCLSKEQFQTLVSQNKDNLLVFNNTITSFDALKNKWLLPFEDSWHASYFKSQNSFRLSL